MHRASLRGSSLVMLPCWARGDGVMSRALVWYGCTHIIGVLFISIISVMISMLGETWTDQAALTAARSSRFSRSNTLRSRAGAQGQSAARASRSPPADP